MWIFTKYGFTVPSALARATAANSENEDQEGTKTELKSVRHLIHFVRPTVPHSHRRTSRHQTPVLVFQFAKYWDIGKSSR